MPDDTPLHLDGATPARRGHLADFLQKKLPFRREHVRHDAVDIDQRRLQHLPTTEREELARQRRGTLGRLLDRRET